MKGLLSYPLLWYNKYMLSKKETEKRKQIKMVSIEDLVPQDHLLRKVEAAMDFSFIYDEVKEYYCEDNGRPSIDPVSLVKLCIINYLYGYNSMRRTIRECEVNMAYRWFIGYDIGEALPHFTTFGKNYTRRFAGTDIFEKIFMRVLSEAMNKGLVDSKTVYIDGTHIKANANTHKNIKKIVEREAKSYEKQLREEIDKDREKHGKKPLKDDDDATPPAEKEITESKIDPESGLFHKGEHKKCFAYNAQVACDKHGWILGGTISSGNRHDSTEFEGIYEEVKKNVGKPKKIVADAGYKTPAIAKKLNEEAVEGYMPYTRPKTKDGHFTKREYVYDEYYDCYICPNNKTLEYSTTNREGYREYKSNREECKDCPYLTKCTASKNTTKVVTRHIWEEHIEAIEENRYTRSGQEIYEKRKETIERIFADGKEKHGMRYTRYKGKVKVHVQLLLTLMTMNLKKLTKFLSEFPEKTLSFFLKIALFPKKTIALS